MDDNFTAQDDRLQFRKCTSNHFEDVCIGSETEFIVLHIDSNVDDHFRICTEEMADRSGVLGVSPR